MCYRFQDEESYFLAAAVRAWFAFYELEPDFRASNTIANAALRFFNEGHKTFDDLSTMLIGTFVGRWAAWANAPTSTSLH